MKIAIIGKGRVAGHLVRAFEECGHDVEMLGGRDRKPARQDVDIVLLSIKDDAIAAVAREVRNEVGEDTLIVHTAGSIPMDVIPGRRGVLYPMQTFTEDREVDFGRITVFVEASGADDLECLKHLARSLGSGVMPLSSQDRKILHLSAVLCCNFVNHMFDLTSEVLAQKNIGFEVMLPLIEETVAKVHTMTPREAQTGPAARWDEKVMDAHLDMIEDERLKTLYRLISESIHDRLRS